MIGIYKITNPKGKIYIGQSTNIVKRKNNYSKLQDCKNQTKLYNSLVKYGYSEHIFEVVEECNIEDLNERERYWQDFYNVLGEGLNLKLTKTGSRSGYCSQETAIKIGNANKGKKKPPRSEEHRKNLSESLKGNTPSEITREKLKQARLGKSPSDKNRLISSERWRSGSNPRARKVLDYSTGTVYNTIKEAAQAIDIPASRLRSWLEGVVKNKSTMQFV